MIIELETTDEVHAIISHADLRELFEVFFFRNHFDCIIYNEKHIIVKHHSNIHADCYNASCLYENYSAMIEHADVVYMLCDTIDDARAYVTKHLNALTI